MPDPVVVVGDGLIATAMREVIRTGAATDLPDLAGVRLLVTARDSWDRRDYERIQQLCAQHGTSWLPVHTELGRIVIGPLYTPGVAGCLACVELRRSLADDQYALRESVRQRSPRLAEQPSPWLTTLTARTVAALVADEVSGSGRSQPGRARGALLYVDLATLAVSTHRFLPDPLCPHCAGLPADDPEAARISLRPRPKAAPGSLRVRQLGEADLDRLREAYVDEQTGLIRDVHTFAGGSLVVGAAAMRGRKQARAESSWGRTLRHRRSETVAILEALERYGGMTPGGRRSVVQASFAEVRDTAVDPRALGLYPPERFSHPGFAFHPFDVDRVCRWVWGYSFAQQAPILVPQAYAYYRAHAADPDDPSFAFEVSNGCALGGCLEEALLYGILEVVERDAFLMTWYGRLSVPRIDVASAGDPAIPMLVEAIQSSSGYRIMVFDTTMEHGIPSVWTMALRPPGSDLPAVACAAGAHLDPEPALVGALCELGPILTDLIGRYAEIAERSRAMAGDASLVTVMDDHSVLYASTQAASRLDFLTESEPVISFAEVRSRHGTLDAFASPDLTDDLNNVLGRLHQHGLDVVVVDQTTPEHRLGGFSCVKVIVPGMLPMTFGQQHRRIHGLPRLFEVPRLLGYRETALAPEDVNPDPHPFP